MSKSATTYLHERKPSQNAGGYIGSKSTKTNIKFRDIEILIKALGGEVREGSGSRVALELSGTREYAHRPHPGKEAQNISLRKFVIG